MRNKSIQTKELVRITIAIQDIEHTLQILNQQINMEEQTTCINNLAKTITTTIIKAQQEEVLNGNHLLGKDIA